MAAAYLERRACTIPPEGGDLRWHSTIKHRSGHAGPALVALAHACLIEARRHRPSRLLDQAAVAVSAERLEARVRQ
jgi:hypothetical protein